MLPFIAAHSFWFQALNLLRSVKNAADSCWRGARLGGDPAYPSSAGDAVCAIASGVGSRNRSRRDERSSKPLSPSLRYP